MQAGAECWLSVLTRKRLTNGAFRSVNELRLAMDTWIALERQRHTVIRKRTAGERGSSHQQPCTRGPSHR